MPILAEFDTIAAISTPIGEDRVSTARLSSEDAVKIANKLFKGKDLSKAASHTINYGHIIDPEASKVVGEVMVSVLPVPKTFTREDTVEINCHGGIVVTNKILQLLLKHGARMAEVGEFTKRASVNGRIDLTQAESVMDIVRVKTDKAQQVAMNQLEDDLLDKIRNMRQKILNTLANVEVNIDYPEYDADQVIATQMQETSKKVTEAISRLLKTADQGKIMRNGLVTAIVGRPNVGKSSLLNYLAQDDKTIVTDVAGTTCDTLEEYVSIRGVPLKLIDTTGIHHTGDKVEKIGIERSKKTIEQTDLVLLLLNASEALVTEDEKLIDYTESKKRIVVLNKADLGIKLDKEDLKVQTQTPIIVTSILKEENLNELEEAISKLFFSGIHNSNDEVLVTNQHQAGLLEKAEDQLTNVIDTVDNNVLLDITQIDFTGARDTLGEITGDSVPDELTTQLFSQSCLGK